MKILSNIYYIVVFSNILSLIKKNSTKKLSIQQLHEEYLRTDIEIGENGWIHSKLSKMEEMKRIMH